MHLRSFDIGGDEVPSVVLVSPAGEVRTSGGVYVCDQVSAQAVMEAFRAHGVDIPIDFEHQTVGGEFARADGKAPAAGWIKGLKYTEGVGLEAEVEWTEEGRRDLVARSYRYLSPVALIAADDRRMYALHSVALTNKPAIAGMRAVVNSELLDEMRAKLGLPQGSPGELFVAACDRIRDLEVGRAEAEAEAAVGEAERLRKISPGQREWALKFARTQLAAFKEWVDAAPEVIASGRLVDGGRQTPTRSSPVDQVMRAAGAEWDREKLLQLSCSREAYVDQAKREAEAK